MSSFPPIAQQAYVCLQCRSHIAAINARAYRILKTGAKKSQRRDFSTQPTSLQLLASVDEDGTRDRTFFESAAAESEDATTQEHDDIKLPDDYKVARAPYAFKRVHLYSKDDLGVRTLGKPAEVLRLRELPDRHKASKWWSKPDDNSLHTNEPLTASDILKRVISERGLASTARVAENIEQLKQDWLASLGNQELGPTESECSRLGKLLYHGFTTKQLSGYLRELRVPRYRYRDVLDLSGPFVSTSFTRLEWRLGVTPFPGKASQRLQAMAKDGREQDVTPAHSATTLLAESRRSGDPFKHVQVNEVIQKCWNIKPREALYSTGEVDITIPEAHLELLASHKRNVLQQLAVEYGAKIDFSKPEHVIRLTANQAICTSSLKLVLMVLDEITCHEMDLMENGTLESEAKDHQSLPNDDALREIGRLSSTVIRRPRNKHAAFPEPHKLLIYSMKTDGESIDDAQRFIRQLCRPSRSSAIVAFYGGRPVASEEPSLVPIVRTVGLPMTERGTKWNRIATDNDKQGVRADLQATEALQGIRKYLEGPNAISKAIKHGLSHPHWPTSLSQESSVVLGRILYPAETMTSIKRERYFLEALKKRHVFDTNVPELRRALELHIAQTHIVQELRVQLKATDTKEEGTHSSELPDLEIRFSVDDRSQIVVPQSVHLILGDRQADLFLPHEPTDLRFATQTYSKATTDLDPHILEFINRSNLCVFGAQKHEVPNRMSIKIPQRLLFWASDLAKSKIGGKSEDAEKSADAEKFEDAEESKDAKESEDAEVLVDYSLVGVEQHHILHSKSDQSHPLRAFNFSFSIIDAGPMGGQRQEVRFFEEQEVEPTQDTLPSEKDDEQDSPRPTINRLYDCVHDLIQNSHRPHQSTRARGRGETDKEGRVHRRLVRKTMSDVPMGTYDEHNLSVQTPLPPIRKPFAKDDPTFRPSNRSVVASGQGSEGQE
ncbi:MAG: hypothetical protein Q9221_006102 [Calogaya cf. arnoldii]